MAKPKDKDAPAAEPETRTAEPVAQPALPADLKDAIALLQRIEAERPTSPQQALDKATRLASVRAHVSRLQQGLPTLSMSPDILAKAAPMHTAALKAERLERLAREHPEVQGLLDRLAELEKRLAKTKP